MSEEGAKAIPEMAVETRLILQELRKLEPGQSIEYTALNRISGCNVQVQRGRGYLNTARERVLRDHGIVTECVRGEGIKRLTPDAMTDVGRHALKKIRGVGRRAARKLAVTDLAALNREQKAEVLALASVLQFVAHCAQEREVKRIEPMTTDRTLELPIGQTLDAFRGDKQPA